MALLKEAKPYLAVIFMQFGYAGSGIIAKAALNHGMSHYAFAIYRNLFAALVFAPFAAVLERKIRPNMTFSVLYKIVLIALLEPVIDQNLYYAAMKYTSATFALAMTNMLPAMTFVLAWILRLEQVNFRSIRSIAKIAGTIVTVGGAMVLTMVKGPTINLPWTKPEAHGAQSHEAEDPIKGAIMITVGCICWASFYNLQAITLKAYPACMSLTSMICGVGALINIILTLVIERGSPGIWTLRFDIILLSYVYSGMITSGVGYFISATIMRAKGPVFVTSFSPLAMVIVAIMSSFLLNEQLTFGRVFGAIIIVIGLYSVIWGKCKDTKSDNIDKIGEIDEQSQDKTNSLNDGKGDATKANSHNNAGDNAV